MSDSSLDHKKGDSKADEGSRLMVGLGLKMGGTVNSKGSNKEDIKLETGTEMGASKRKGETEGGSSSGLGMGDGKMGARASVCILKLTWTDCLGSGDSVCMLQSA